MRALPSLLSRISRLIQSNIRTRRTLLAFLRGFAGSLIILPVLVALCPMALPAEAAAKMTQDDWSLSAVGQKLELPGYDLYSVRIENGSDKDRSILGLIHMASRSGSGNPEKTARCQFFASVPAGKSVEIQVPCKWESPGKDSADSINLEIEKTFPFILETDSP